MKKIHVIALFFISMVLSLSNAVIAQHDLVKAEIRVVDTTNTSRDKVSVEVTVTNISGEPVKILRWLLADGRIDENVFSITRDGQAVRYQGRVVKRAAPTARDYLVIQPGEHHVATLELTSAYDVTTAGSYEIKFSSHTFVAPLKRKRLPGEAVPVGEMESNTTGFSMDGSSYQAPIGLRKKEAFYNYSKLSKSTTSYCNSSQKSMLQRAEDSAIEMAVSSISYIEDHSYTSEGKLYSTWFGAPSYSRYNRVSSNFKKLKDALDNKNIVYNCNCDDSYYAYVYPNSPYEIYVCRSFWPASNDSGLDTKAGTILHELSHFTIIAETDDHAYGTYNVQSLARNDPNKAVYNADSHEYFAESVPEVVEPTCSTSYAFSAPTNLQIEALAGNSISVNWDAVNYASTYTLEVWVEDDQAGAQYTASSNSRKLTLKSKEIERDTNGKNMVHVRVKAGPACNTNSEFGDWKKAYLSDIEEIKTYTGTLSGSKDHKNHPSGNDNIIISSGTLEGQLVGPKNSDFELFLYKKVGSNWKIVKFSKSNDSNELIQHPVSERGTYYFKVKSYKGSGAYTLTVKQLP